MALTLQFTCMLYIVLGQLKIKCGLSLENKSLDDDREVWIHLK
jgi:hypothetical protein